MSDADINYTEPAVKFKKYQKRRNLLPWWIKTFCWIFMVMAAIIPFGIVASALHMASNFAIFGIETHDLLSAKGAAIMAIFLFNGLAALFLWMQKPWAVRLAKINAIVNILICIGVMVYGMGYGNFSIRLELIPLGIYLYRLSKIQHNWDNFDTLDEGIDYTDPLPLSE
jgi:hypothetical protein